MADPKKPVRDPIAALLDFSTDYEQTPVEATEELRSAGVDVDGFVARLRDRLARQAVQSRLAWLTTARAQVASDAVKAVPEKYKAMDRSALISALKGRQSVPGQAQAYHHKLDDVKDDDLRTLLADLDDLDDDTEDPA